MFDMMFRLEICAFVENVITTFHDMDGKYS